MSLLPGPIGSSIAAIIKAARPSPGQDLSDAQLQTMWVNIMTAMYNDVKASAVVSVNVTTSSTIVAETIITVGTAATQAGPQLPLPVAGSGSGSGSIS